MDIRLFSVCIYLLATICTPVKSCGTKIPHGHVREGCQDFCRYWCDQGYEEVLEYPFVDCVVNRNNSWVPYKDEDEGVSEANLCRPKKCPEITVPNGNLQACVPTVGYSCSYSCKPGYSQKSSHISCLPTTEWSENPLVLCTSQNQCPYEIPKGALNFSCSRNPGDVCSFSCDLGMITDVPSRTLTCGETSTWNKALDSVCRVIKCPEEIPNGHIGSSCGRDFTDRCHFYCDTGFEKSPNLAFLTCNGSAQWEWHNQKEIPAVCLDKTRLCPALIENGKIYKYCSRSIGSKCGYSCDRYCSKNSHVPRLTCESDLTWQPQGRLCWDCGVGTCNSKIPHGNVMDNCQESCLYYCDLGYEATVSLHSLKCSLNNTWVPKWENRHVSEEELCRPKSCPNITIPNSDLGTCPGKVDTTCSYSCKTGYSQKSTEVACLKTTEWDENPHALCTNNMQCPYEIPRGALEFSCNRNPGDNCTYTCDAGHLPFDMSRKVRCGTDSSWDKPLNSICSVIRCPERILHGSISSSCGRGFGDYCIHYNCDLGYEKPDTYQLKCNGSAQWEILWSLLLDTQELCIPKRCPEIYIPNGNMSTCNMTVDSNCSYTCHTGFSQRSTYITCLPAQVWNLPPQTLCTNDMQCPLEIPRGDLNATCGRNLGEVCSYTCDEGMIAFNTSMKITCGSNATWDITLESICTVIECPVNISKASLSPSCSRGYNNLCQYYTCPPGYDKESLPLRMRCNESSQWAVERNNQPYTGELCIARSCPAFHVPNGKHGKCLSKVDSVCSYKCDEGYRQMSSALVCLPTSKWALDLHSLCYNSEQCEQYQIPNGQLDPNCARNPGDRCSFTCDEGMMPLSGTVKCRRRDSIWDKTFLSLCSVLRCPGTIPGGFVSSNCGRSFNDKCYSFTCKDGYEKVYSVYPTRPYLRCNESAQWAIHWSGGSELCLDKNQMCPSTITNGTIVSATSCQRTVGAMCEFTCDRYCSRYYGLTYLTCQSDLTWSTGDRACYNCHIPTTTLAPVCSRTIPRGTISSSCPRKRHEYCSYTCDYGCRKTRSSLYCNWRLVWDSRYSACDCDYRTTSTYNNADIYDSEDSSETSSGLTTALIIIGVIVFLVVICVFIYGYRKQQQESPQPTITQPTSDTPVVYHPVTTNTQVVTNGRRDDPPNYNSIGPGDERNVEPLLSDTRTTPSAPDGPSEAEGGVSPSALVNDLDGYPPPPSYSEVVSDPEKYQTQRENQETQVE